MIFYLAGIDSFFLFGIFFLVITSISVLGLFMTHKYLFPNFKLHDNRFLVPFFSINGAILGFLLAMVLVESWKNYQDEKDNLTVEMSSYISIYRNTRGLKASDSVTIKKYLKTLVNNIIEKSWPALEEGKDDDYVSSDFNAIQRQLLSLEIKNDEQRDLKKIMIENLNKASELRRHRLLKATDDVVPLRMWLVLLCCIFLSIFCGYFFIIKPFSIHIILTILQCTMISFVLFLMISFLYPYRGPMKIQPFAFERLMNKTFPNIDQDDR